MSKAKEFKTVLNITRIVCEFIAGEHSSVFRRITGVTFGVSTSIVTIRPFEKSPDLENLQERTKSLYEALIQYGAKELTVDVFSSGIKIVDFYNEKGSKYDQQNDTVPDGMLFRVDLGGRKDVLLKDQTLLIEAVGHTIFPLLDETSKPEIFLNGERLLLPK